ncbi:MAG TPA: hypothetical protein DDX68_18520 [Clostridium sp.]|nr:hypothetical protein [Clostridium sp.]
MDANKTFKLSADNLPGLKVFLCDRKFFCPILIIGYSYKKDRKGLLEKTQKQRYNYKLEAVKKLIRFDALIFFLPKNGEDENELLRL